MSCHHIVKHDVLLEKNKENFSRLIPVTTCVTVRVFLSEFVNYEARGSRPFADEHYSILIPGLDTSRAASVSDMAYT